MKIGRLVVAYINVNNPDLSDINTMLQIRNLPMNMVLGGTLYAASLSGQGANHTIQLSSVLYIRPNIKSSNFADPVSGVGWFTMCIIGMQS